METVVAPGKGNLEAGDIIMCLYYLFKNKVILKRENGGLVYEFAVPSFWTMVGGTAWWKWIEACIFLGLDMTQVKKLSLE